ncbi:helix-turn-helix domain-containing protein [Nonomuraea sp. NPDC050790]|uniref:helix-turn-helix domain-containing protein n=1 Tax=Nonomuraea sp. NPDC050790 TaxID=3364371 RepID=UPI0037BA1D62
MNDSHAGALLRRWRRRRKVSQLELSLLADTSARHLSYVETGRSRPSRTMVLRLAEALEVPLRERNTLLVAAGYAPAYRDSGLQEQGGAAVTAMLETMLTAHEPYPAVVVDRLWNVVRANTALGVLMNGVAPALAAETPNVFRLTLHPDGLASRLVNYGQVRALFLRRLRRQADAGDPALRALLHEVSRYPAPENHHEHEEEEMAAGPIQVPLRVRTPVGELSMFSTMATFGSPADVTLSELAIELFYPLDDFTATTLRHLSAQAL